MKEAEWLPLVHGGEIMVVGGDEEEDRYKIGFRISLNESWGFFRTIWLAEADVDRLIAALQRAIAPRSTVKEERPIAMSRQAILEDLFRLGRLMPWERDELEKLRNQSEA